MAKKDAGGVSEVFRVFGMTRDDIAAAADALSEQKDQNHPTKTGTYRDFFKSLKAGSEALSRQGNYCRKKP
jgi:hypothetical protein